MIEALNLPSDLVEYLANMVTPFHVEGQILYVPEGGIEDWSSLEDQSFHAALFVGDPSAYIDELWRVLKPGAHVLAVAPENQPTGHTGACALEDAGFEIRDAILWVTEPGKYHYVPKPSQRERHAGCEDLKLRRKERAEEADPDLEDGEEVVDEGGASDEPIELHSHKGNAHPTVKPKAIMERLLGDVPKDAPVLDPFMGSGSTALACLETGHDFIGIEREDEYLEIADARVRYWDRSRIGDGATIVSEFDPPKDAADEVDLDDFFDL